MEKQFGPQVDREVIEHFVQHAYQKAVQDEELRPAAHPRLDLSELELAPGADLNYEFEILLRPDIELGDVTQLSVQGQSVAVTEEELDQQLEELRRQASRPEAVEDEGLPEDGMALCSVSFHLKDSEEAVLERDGIRLSPGTAPAGLDADAFKEGLTGAKNEETREFEFDFPDDFPSEEARGQKGTCRVGIKEAYRIVPPTDEELFAPFEVSDADGLREAVRTRMVEAKTQQEEHRLENELLEKLIADHPMELPEPLIEDQAQGKVNEMREALEGQDLDPETIEERLKEEHERALQASTHAMRAVYLMEEVAKRHEIKVEEKDLLDELDSIAKRNDADPAEVRKYYQEEGLVNQLALELLERKVRRFLRESADIQLADA